MTVLESVEQLRALMNAGAGATLREQLPTARVKEAASDPGASEGQGRTPPPMAGGDDAPTGSRSGANDGTLRYRPAHRPAVPLLLVFDDDLEDGELIRIRGESFVIGRVNGDLVLSQDEAVSGRHAEIRRIGLNSNSRWMLRDLESTNGTFVRVSSALLTDRQDLLLGGRRYRFEERPAGAESSPENEGSSAAAGPGQVPRSSITRKWDAPVSRAKSDDSPSAFLIEVGGVHDGQRYRLIPNEVWIGRDPHSCTIAIDDPFLNQRHARILLDRKGRWSIENAGSLNGVWLGISEIDLGHGGYFQCGEQRFLIRIP